MTGFAWISTDIALILHSEPIGLFRIGRCEPREPVYHDAVLVYIETLEIVLLIYPTSADSRPRLTKHPARLSQNLVVRLKSYRVVLVAMSN